MKKIIFALLILQSTCFAAELPAKDRVTNKSPGYCTWSCLEMLGRVHKVEKLYGLRDARAKDPDELRWSYLHKATEIVSKNIGTEEICSKKLKSLGVKHKIVHCSEDLNRANRDCCVVFMAAGAFGDLGHAVVLIEFNNTFVKWIDPNDIIAPYWVARDWFDSYWQGTAIFLEEQ